jgi:hypothetical protein
MSKSRKPLPEEVITMASSYGFVEYRQQVNATIFLEKIADNYKINVFYSTRGLMTILDHPKGRKPLWRSSAYKDLSGLEALLANPRLHTSFGYRKSADSATGCIVCGERKQVTEFSRNQWTMRKDDKQKCRDCVDQIQQARRSDEELRKLLHNMGNIQIACEDSERTETAVVKSKAVSKQGMHYENFDKQNRRDDEYQIQQARRSDEEIQQLLDDMENIHIVCEESENTGPLTVAALAKHGMNQENFARRQFNCPNHADPFIFFKKVPIIKPVAKCPMCKQGKQPLPRLQPIPTAEERGFGLFKCPNPKCGSTWGSSRACRCFSQACHDPLGVGRYRSDGYSAHRAVLCCDVM